MSASPPVAAFLAACPHPVAPSRALADMLSDIDRRARAAWPTIAVEVPMYMAWLGARVSADRDPQELLASLHTDDLYLACGCVGGDPNALAELDRLYLSQIGLYIRRIDPEPAFADEVRQHVAEDLLVVRTRTPGLVRYSGRGALGAFIRLAAIRTARYLRRGQKPVLEARSAGEPAGDLELELLKRRHAGEFEACFPIAIAALDPIERSALKMHFVDGLGMEAIARIYQVNKSTVSRWIASARRLLFTEVRRLLAERLDVPAGELDSLVAALQSRVDVTLRWFA